MFSTRRALTKKHPFVSPGIDGEYNKSQWLGLLDRIKWRRAIVRKIPAKSSRIIVVRKKERKREKLLFLCLINQTITYILHLIFPEDIN